MPFTRTLSRYYESATRCAVFDAYSEEQGIKKPDAEIFWRAVNKLGVSPEESVFVGDHPVNDVLAAQNIGMRAIWKRDRFWQNDVTSDAVIDDLSELISWVESRK